MSNPPTNVWAARASRASPANTPTQNRSANASPAPVPAANVWQQRTHERTASVPRNDNSSSQNRVEKHEPVNGFNSAEVKEFLGREGVRGVYLAAGGGKEGKAGTMANGQPFMAQLARQVAVLEGGG